MRGGDHLQNSTKRLNLPLWVSKCLDQVEGFVYNIKSKVLKIWMMAYIFAVETKFPNHSFILIYAVRSNSFQLLFLKIRTKRYTNVANTRVEISAPLQHIFCQQCVEFAKTLRKIC